MKLLLPLLAPSVLLWSTWWWIMWLGATSAKTLLGQTLLHFISAAGQRLSTFSTSSHNLRRVPTDLSQFTSFDTILSMELRSLACDVIFLGSIVIFFHWTYLIMTNNFYFNLLNMPPLHGLSFSVVAICSGPLFLWTDPTEEDSSLIKHCFSVNDLEKSNRRKLPGNPECGLSTG